MKNILKDTTKGRLRGEHEHHGVCREGSYLLLRRICGFLATVVLVVVVAACGGGSNKSYDIGEFTFSAEKCAEYGGTYDEESITESCMVTRDECERAAGEWNASMQEGGVNDAIDFSCD